MHPKNVGFHYKSNVAGSDVGIDEKNLQLLIKTLRILKRLNAEGGIVFAFQHADSQKEKLRDMKKPFLLALGILTLAVESRAGVIFSDNFNNENGGVGFLNYGTPNQNGAGLAGSINTSFAQWTVTGGTVDLLPIPVNTGPYPGPYALLPSSYGQYVDLDGTTGQNGTLTSVPISLGIGTYDLFFDLAGSQRGEASTALISVQTGVTNKSVSLAANQAATTYEIEFSLAAPQIIHLSFQDTTSPGNDDIGPLLDNILLETAGDPSAPDAGSTALLLGVAVLGLGLLRRRILVRV